MIGSCWLLGVKRSMAQTRASELFFISLLSFFLLWLHSRGSVHSWAQIFQVSSSSNVAIRELFVHFNSLTKCPTINFYWLGLVLVDFGTDLSAIRVAYWSARLGYLTSLKNVTEHLRGVCVIIQTRMLSSEEEEGVGTGHANPTSTEIGNTMC